MTAKTLLKLTLLIGGIGFIVGFGLGSLGLYLPIFLSQEGKEIALVYEHMLAAFYLTLGGFMIATSRSPNYSYWAPLFFFLVVSSYIHAGIMLIDVIKGNPAGISLIFGIVGLSTVATLLLITRKVWQTK